MKRKLLLAIGLLLTLLMLTGCGAGKKIIGVQADGENIYKVDVTNDTKKTITKVQIQDNSMKDFSDNMLQQDSIFAAGETETMYVNGEAAKEAAKNSAKSEESYQMKLTFDDKSEKTLTDVPFSDMKACSIKWDRDSGIMAYLTYTSQKDGKEVSTKDVEIQKKQDAEKKAAEQKAAAQKAAEKKAAEQKAAEQRERENQSTTQSNDTGSGNENSGQNNTDYSNNYDNNYNSYSESNGGYSGGETYQPADYGGEY